MTNFIKKHNEWISQITDQMKKGDMISPKSLDFHESKVTYLQHERLIHLLVLIFVGMVLISFFITSLFVDMIVLYLLILILFVLFIFYIRHYYLLENSIQHWYLVTEQLMTYTWEI